MLFKRKLGDSLVRAKIITKTQLMHALDEQQKNKFKLGYNLVHLGYIDEETLASFLSKQFNTPTLSPKSIKIEEDLFKLIPDEIMKSNFIIPISKIENSLTIAMSDPSDKKIIKYLEQITQLNITSVVSPQSSIKKILDKNFFRDSLPDFLRTQSDSEHICDLFSELPDYKIIDVLGEGGFGKIFKCYQVSLDRYVAVKTLSKSLARNQEIVERFKREGKIIARLNHPNIVKIIDQGEIDEYFYFVMEYIEGVPLNKFLHNKDILTKLSLFIQICDALDHAHKFDVVHRDVKPQNILVEKDVNIKLLDFGISLIENTGNTRLTDPFLVLGTPKYMSPEQSNNPLEVNLLSDIYSLGVILFEVFTEVDYTPENLKTPVTFKPNIPKQLNDLIIQCLKQNKSDRIQSCEELKFKLSQVKEKIILGNEIIIDSPNKSKDIVGTNFPTGISSIKRKYDFLRIIKQENGYETILAEHKGLDKLVIIKKFKDKNGFNEAKLLSRMKYPHIVEILGVAEDKDSYMVVLEYLEGGSLELLIHQKPPMSKIITMLNDIINAIDFGYKNKIPHNNLHPNNILFDTNGNLKIMDFNIKSTAPKKYEKYFPNNNSKTIVRDFFSIGVIFYELVSGKKYDIVSGPEWNFFLIKDMDIYPKQVKTVLERLLGIDKNNTRYNSTSILLDDIKFLEKKMGEKNKSEYAVKKKVNISNQENIEIKSGFEDNKKMLIAIISITTAILFLIIFLLYYYFLRK